MSESTDRTATKRREDGRGGRLVWWVKPLSQWACLVLFGYCFAYTAHSLESAFNTERILTMDPLIAICSFLSDWRVPSGLLAGCVLLVGTFLLGRYFCGYMCPIGAMVDGVDVLTHFIRRRMPVALPSALRIIKYVFLAFILACALLGSVQFLWLDPLSMATRFATQFAYTPLAEWLADESARPMLPIRRDGLTPLLLALVLLPSLVQSRFWCRNLCPLGALLAVVGRRGRLPRVTEACVRCGRCSKACAMGAIASEEIQVSKGECHQCMRCAVACPVQAVEWRKTVRATPEEEAAMQPWSRRRFMRTVGATAVAAVATHMPVQAALRLGREQALLRPPGVFDEAAFLKRCIRCGACMKACPVRALQPVRWENGLSGIGSPHFRMRDAGCHPECNGCGQVCPTRAIPPLPLHRKNTACIGLAEVDHETCLLSQGIRCAICRRVCVQAGYGAIGLQGMGNYTVGIVVHRDRCVGCGWCEVVCPVGLDPDTEAPGPAAIRVTARTDGATFREKYRTSQRAQHPAR